MRRLTCGAAVLLAAAGAAAQGVEIFIDVSNPEPTPGETITITLQAGFEARDYAIAGVATNFEVSALQGELSNWRLLDPMRGPGTERGELVGDSIEGILAGQLNFPGTGAIYADPTNPMPFWAIDLTVSDVLSGPVVLDVRTRTIRYDVYVDRMSSLSESRLDVLVEGELRVLVGRDCAVDLDGDGEATVFDFLAFFNLFDLADPLADFDGDGEFTLFDFLEFQTQFMAGC
ncbi:MAG: hypothetical protein NCW75_00030 [Phycisphaera sp.]|nr:MAG: hypothetical protein NCW75_00030 [Phycisphaera sp.]